MFTHNADLLVDERVGRHADRHADAADGQTSSLDACFAVVAVVVIIIFLKVWPGRAR